MQGRQTGLGIGSAYFGAGGNLRLSGRIGAPSLALTSGVGQKICPSKAGQTKIPGFRGRFMPQTHFRGGFEPKPGLDFRGRMGRGKKTGSARALGALPSLAPLDLLVNTRIVHK